MTEKWKIELTNAVIEIAHSMPELIEELKRINDQREATPYEGGRYKEQSTPSEKRDDN